MALSKAIAARAVKLVAGGMGNGAMKKLRGVALNDVHLIAEISTDLTGRGNQAATFEIGARVFDAWPSREKLSVGQCDFGTGESNAGNVDARREMAFGAAPNNDSS